MNPYDVLGVAPDADDAAVKRAYRARAHKAHPDKGGSEAEFHEIVKSYEILSDAKRREQYDKHGDTSEGPDKQQVILSTLASMILGIIEHDANEQIDAIAEARKMCKAKVEQIEQAIDRAKEKAARFRKQADRFKRKSKGQNFLHDAILAHVRVFEAQAAAGERELEIGKEVFQALGEYECRFKAANRGGRSPSIPETLNAVMAAYARGQR